MSKTQKYIHQLLLEATKSCNKFKIHMYTTILKKLNDSQLGSCTDVNQTMQEFLTYCKYSDYPKEYEFVKELIKELKRINA